MDRSRFNQLLTLIVVFGLATVIKSWYQVSYILVWLGAFSGFFLPNIDFLIYAYILRSDKPVSEEIKELVKNKNIFKLGDFSKDLVRFEKLIFHTAYFQVIFMILTFFIVSSSGSLFGRGFVYAASLKLFLEQLWEYKKSKNLSYWFSEMGMNLNSDQTKAYLVGVGFALLIFATML